MVLGIVNIKINVKCGYLFVFVLIDVYSIFVWVC